MASSSRPVVTPQFVLGMFLTLAGIVLMLDRVNLVEAERLRPFWPLLIIAIGAAMLVQRRDASGRFWGGVWTVVGTWFLLNTLGWLQVTIWQMIGPLVLILIGGTVLLHALRQRPSSHVAPGATYRLGAESNGPPAAVPPVPGAPNYGNNLALQSTPDGVVTLFTVMGEAKRASNDRPFRGGEMTAFMGGCLLDLRQAVIEPGQEAVLNVLAVMAGHEIRVPPGWAVALDVVPLLGGVDDKRLPPLEPMPPDPPRLRLKGFVLMGGIVIR